VAGLVSGVAFAQSAPSGASSAPPSNNVTLYGRVDLGYVYSKSDYKKFQGIEDGNSPTGNTSMIGVRGEEALGNGLKAIYQFEWGVTADDGAGPGVSPAYGRRYTYAGLSGNFGRVTFGRQSTPMDNFYISGSDVFGTTGIRPFSVFRGKLSFMNATAMRWDNSIAYNSPRFSGVEFTGIYSFGEKVNAGGGNDDNGAFKSADTSDAGKLGLGVKYANGPLYLVALYMALADDDSVAPYGVPSNTGYGAKGWGIGGAYDFKVVKLHANYIREKANHDGLATGPNDGSDKQAFWTVSAGIPVSSAGTVTLEYGQYKDYVHGVRGTTAISHNVDGGGKSKGYMVGYRHVLSRRTSLNVYASQFSNDKNVTSGYAKTIVQGEKQTNFVVSILHLF
jgi:predicted porin